MKIWIFEDKEDTIEILTDKLRDACDAAIEVLQTVEAASRALDEISDNDLVFVDSQVSAEAAGEIITDAGVRLVAKLRARGCACRILWHSVSPSDALSGLGVERIGAKDISHSLFTLDAALARTTSNEEWQLRGQALLERLLASEVPLSEFGAMSVLCQGFLAIVGAAWRFPNEVADALQKSEGGRKCLAESRGQLVEALNVYEWFKAGRDNISAAVRKHGGIEEDYWHDVCDEQEELESKVAAIRGLYERLRLTEQADASHMDNWHASIVGAHRGLQELFERRYL